jgi:hypothetical protein
VINANSIARHLSSKGAAAELAPLVEQLAKRADSNRDGKVSSSEFNDFLTKLMQSIDDEHGTTAEGTERPGTTATGPVPVASASVQTPASAASAIRAIVAAVSKER